MPLGAQRVKQLHLIFLEPYTTIEEDTKGNIRPLHQLQNRNQRQQTIVGLSGMAAHRFKNVSSKMSENAGAK